GLSDALSRMAAALRDEPQGQRADVLDGIDLGLIAGRITRVERRRRSSRAVTTIVSAGAGFWAACSRIVHRAPQAGTRANGRAIGDVVALHGLVVHYEPTPEVTERQEPELLLGNAHRFDISAGPLQQGTVIAPKRRVVVARGLRRLANLT